MTPFDIQRCVQIAERTVLLVPREIYSKDQVIKLLADQRAMIAQIFKEMNPTANAQPPAPDAPTELIAKWRTRSECADELESWWAARAMAIPRCNIHNRDLEELANGWLQCPNCQPAPTHLAELQATLRRQVELAAIRYQMLLDRMAGCQNDDTGGHEVSKIEVPGWIDEARAALAHPTGTEDAKT